MDPPAFALFVVGFSDVDGDRALAVAGQWQRSEGRVGQKTKTERGPLLPRHAINRQAETHQSVNDAAFGRFDLGVRGEGERWRMLESAKRRVSYTLIGLGLPIAGVGGAQRTGRRDGCLANRGRVD